MKPTDPKTWPAHMQAALSPEERIKCGIGSVVKKEPESATTMATAPAARKGMNKTELEYHRMLLARKSAGELLEVYPHESLKFCIGEKRCWYTPDFVVISDTGFIAIHEVKGGHVWDDAKVKFQSAKRQYPHFAWIWAQKKQGKWEIT